MASETGGSTLRATALRTTVNCVLGPTSSVIRSLSISMMVPKIPAVVITSSPTSRVDIVLRWLWAAWVRGRR